MKNKRYLYNPKTYSIFEEIEPNRFKQFSYNETFPYEKLINYGYKPCTEDDLDWLKDKNDFYNKYILWKHYYNGTEEEYKEHLNTIKIYQRQQKLKNIKL